MLKSGIIYIKSEQEERIETYGYRDLANQIQNNSETRFPTASAGKTFVAVAILSLIEQGKLSFDTTLKDVLTYDLGNVDLNVTVYMLLTHTSGVPDYFDEDEMDDYAKLWDQKPNYSVRGNLDLLPLFIHKPMQYHPGLKFKYNDSGYVLLGLIIEAVTQQPFDDYLNELLFQPLAMKHTGYYELDRLPMNCANAYIWDSITSSYYTNIYSIDAKGSGAGGAFTNPSDIHKFWDALVNHRILSASMTEKMLEKHQKVGDWGYGLGVWLDEHQQPMMIGEDPGAAFVSLYNRQTNQEITIISNMQENVIELLYQLKKSP